MNSPFIHRRRKEFSVVSSKSPTIKRFLTMKFNGYARLIRVIKIFIRRIWVANKANCLVPRAACLLTIRGDVSVMMTRFVCDKVTSPA